MRFWSIALSLLVASFAHAGAADKKLDIFWIDTEGGAATLFVTPAGESVLIDTGNPGKPGDAAPRDATRIHKLATEVAGLKKIDFLVTTHYHIDHFGGAADLAKMMPIGVVYDNGDFGGREKPTADYLNFKCDKRVVYNPGDTLPVKQVEGSPKLSFTCICARQQTITPARDATPRPLKDPKRKAPDISDNANSIVQIVEFGNFRMYVGGDLTWNIEEKLVNPVNLIGRIDLYQVTHHGLDISNNPLVIQACKPTVVVMPNGPTKGGMPEVFETIKATNSIIGIYQLHKNLRPGEEKVNVPDEFIANKEKECQGNYIRCEIAPDSKRYTMSIPATKHEQKYETR
jgi:beta-lactamase superfamily II metal-dependent hydrolase